MAIQSLGHGPEKDLIKLTRGLVPRNADTGQRMFKDYAEVTDFIDRWEKALLAEKGTVGFVATERHFALHVAELVYILEQKHFVDVLSLKGTIIN